MHVSTRTGRLRGGRWSSGFSLMEVVIASGLLLTTITAVTICVTSVSAGGARLQRVMDADRAVRLVADRLAAMPFWEVGAGAAADAAGEDLLAVVFPHADATRNTPTARYVHADAQAAPAGAFATVFTTGGVEVLCVARFLTAAGGQPLEPSAVQGWSAADGDQPPGCALSLWLTATSRGTTRGAGFTLAALESAPISSATPATAT